MNDIYLIVYRISTQNNCKTLEKVYQICLKYTQKHNALFARKKYKLIYLMCNPKRFNMEAKIDLDFHQISLKIELKMLDL